MRISLVIAILAIVVLVIAAVQYVPDWFGASQEPPVPAEVVMPSPVDMTPQQQPPEPASVDPGPDALELVLPPLSESDDFVRAELEPLALPEDWAQRDDLARRMAVVLANAADGQYPQRQLAFMAPRAPFQVVERDDRKYIDPASYQRFDSYLDLLERVEPDALAQLIDRLRPLLTEALGELGSDLPPNAQIKGAIDLLLEVPVLSGDVEVVQPKVFYEYADPTLEALPPLKKLALRMGPTNLQRLKAYLSQLRLAL